MGAAYSLDPIPIDYLFHRPEAAPNLTVIPIVPDVAETDAADGEVAALGQMQ
jgi:hypothetical protein